MQAHRIAIILLRREREKAAGNAKRKDLRDQDGRMQMSGIESK